MTSAAGGPWSPARTDELRAVLDQALRDQLGEARGISALARRPSAYRTSFALEELDLDLDDGTTLPLVFKDLSMGALHELARRAKPGFIYEPRREIAVYRDLLAPSRRGTARCYATVCDERSGRYWLFLERVPGAALHEVGEFSTWERVARWLARLHTGFAGARDLTSAARGAHLIDYDAHFYRAWIRRARAFACGGDTRAPSREHCRELERLAGRYERVVARLAALPRTLIHGEFFPSNILVQPGAGRLRICPVDWEMAALGPGLVDLAALVAGGWTAGEVRALALAYQEALPTGARWPDAEEFMAALDWCRLHLAVQWLGWSADWSPPAEHAHDWLHEALSLAERLEL